VVAAYTANDLGAFWQPGPLLVRRRRLTASPSTCGPTRRSPRIRSAYVGEPLAIVIATSRYIAKMRWLTLPSISDELPAVVDLERALAAARRSCIDDLPSNISAYVRQTKGDYAAAARRADRIVPPSLPLRARHLVAHGNARRRRAVEKRAVRPVTMWDTTQAPVFVRNGLPPC